MSPREWSFFISDILQSVRLIQEYVQGMTLEEFTSDQKTIDAVVRNFIIIGEASKNIPEDIRTQHPEIPWLQMAGMRNFTVHVYWGVELATVWDTIHNDLPAIVPPLERLNKTHSDPSR